MNNPEKIVLYHISNEEFQTFSTYSPKAAQQVIWFSLDPEKLKAGLSGADDNEKLMSRKSGNISKTNDLN